MKNLGFSFLLFLAACQALPAQEPALKHYDLGMLPAMKGSSSMGTAVVVQNPDAFDWLQSTNIYYRFTYNDPVQVRRYALSRWISPPPQLLAPLMRGLLAHDVLIASRKAGNHADWELSTNLVDFEQVFVTPDQSYGRVRLNATLIRLSDRAVLARRSFVQDVEARQNNAQGGVKALSEASLQIVRQIGVWLARSIQVENLEH